MSVRGILQGHFELVNVFGDGHGFSSLVENDRIAYYIQ